MVVINVILSKHFSISETRTDIVPTLLPLVNDFAVDSDTVLVAEVNEPLVTLGPKMSVGVAELVEVLIATADMSELLTVPVTTANVAYKG